MQVVSLGTFIDDQHGTTLALQQVIPVNEVVEERGIAGGMSEGGVVEGAAQAAGDAVGRGGVGEAQGFEFSGNLGDDAGLSSQDTGSKEGEAVARGGRDAFGDSSRDALAESLIEWEMSGHE
jgi:hypothetical protein